MKKVLIAVFLLLLVAFAGAAGYFILNPAPAATPERQPPQKGGIGFVPQPTAPAIGGVKASSTDADLLEALHYELPKNRDTVAWLFLPNTEINNSVLQSHDNLFYLRKNERLQEDIYGCYFADAECNVAVREELSQNTVIYGHSDLKDNPMGPRFSQLFLYTQEEFARSNRRIFLATPTETLEWEIFSVFYTDTSFDYIRVLMTPEQTLSLARQAAEKSLYEFEVALTEQDKLSGE